MSLDAELAELKKRLSEFTLGEAKKEYTLPSRRTFIQDFLTHEQEREATSYLHEYNPEAPITYDGDPDFILVVHNHSSDVPCFARDFCFSFGYEPVGTEHPGFIKLFWDRNGKYYGRGEAKNSQDGSDINNSGNNFRLTF